MMLKLAAALAPLAMLAAGIAFVLAGLSDPDGLVAAFFRP